MRRALNQLEAAGGATGQSGAQAASRTGETMLVTLTTGQLTALVRTAVQEALAEQVDGALAPALLDRQGLGQALGCSLATVDRMRREAGFPELRVGDAARFELAEVLAWLRNREPPAVSAESSAAANPDKHGEMPSNTNGFSHENSAMADDHTAATRRKSP